MANEYHAPVLLHDCVEGLNIRPDGIYVDATFGGGGHSRAILEKLGPKGRLIAFDRDADAASNMPDDPRFTLVRSDFRWLKNHLRYLNALPVQGLLADLGVSSHQFDVGERGFSFRSDGPLDMRMDQRNPLSAADLIARSDVRTLTDIIRRYGEVQRPDRVAHQLVKAREERPITTTRELVGALEPFLHGKGENSFLAQVFQAFRIAVNDELGSLGTLLQVSAEVIAPGGRLVIISYHSLEDRLVKRWMRTGNIEGRETKDVFGNVQRPFRPVNKKATQPSMEEVARNPRARSAKARIAERTE